MAASPKQFQSDYDFRDGFNVTPSDSVNLAQDAGNTVGYTFANALLVRATGDVSFLTPTGLTISMTAVPVSTYIVVAAKRVNLTGTTAQIAALIR